MIKVQNAAKSRMRFHRCDSAVVVYGEQVWHDKIDVGALMIALAIVVLLKLCKQRPQFATPKFTEWSKHSSRTVRAKRLTYALQFGLCAGMTT